MRKIQFSPIEEIILELLLHMEPVRVILVLQLDKILLVVTMELLQDIMQGRIIMELPLGNMQSLMLLVLFNLEKELMEVQILFNFVHILLYILMEKFLLIASLMQLLLQKVLPFQEPVAGQQDMVKKEMLDFLMQIIHLI